MSFSTIDLVILGVYLVAMMALGLWLSRSKDGDGGTQEYFLAGKSLPWWAIGASLIASNISTEQILAMNGSGYEVGMAIAGYELLAALTLIIVAKFFLPIFIHKEIYTMPQFLERRFDGRVRSVLSVFWVALFVFVNITSVLYLGGLAIQSILGVPLIVGIIGLVIYSAAFSIFGGLKAVVWTDVVQVVVLVIGGLIATYLVVSAVGDGSFLAGMSTIWEQAPERFDMVFDIDDTYVDTSTGETKSAYDLLPGVTVIMGGMWIANLYYWGSNQYIIQRALAAKTLGEAQKGVAFAGLLKLGMPFIVVLPGIAGYVLGAEIEKADQIFPWVLNEHVIIGVKGLVMAALVAAVGSSISSMVNSATTIFTLDIYRPLINKGQSEAHYVRVGKIVAAICLVIGALIGPALDSLGQVFQYIQEYTGFISPGVVAVFLFGMFWRRTTSNAALAVVILAIPLSLGIRLGFPDVPFLDRMGITFLLCSALLVIISLLDTGAVKEVSLEKDADPGPSGLRLGLIVSMIVIGGVTAVKILVEGVINPWVAVLTLSLLAVAGGLLLFTKERSDRNGVVYPSGLFQTSTMFNVSATAIVLVLALIYAILW
ncbi:MAG: sodium/solute symporter [Bacteroidota bacterium]